MLIVYLDSSALTKLYILEEKSASVQTLISQAWQVGTSDVTLTEVSAAIAKGVRAKLVWPNVAETAMQRLRFSWQANQLIRLPVTSALCSVADPLVWQHQLRAYDAIHLAAALEWQRSLAQTITVATFDIALWEASKQANLGVWPDSLNGIV